MRPGRVQWRHRQWCRVETQLDGPSQDGGSEVRWLHPQWASSTWLLKLWILENQRSDVAQTPHSAETRAELTDDERLAEYTYINYAVRLGNTRPGQRRREMNTQCPIIKIWCPISNVQYPIFSIQHPIPISDPKSKTPGNRETERSFPIQKVRESTQFTEAEGRGENPGSKKGQKPEIQ